MIGAGVGGLAAAARLAAGGHEVTVCEQAAGPGGKLGWWQRDGFSFDTGPSLLTLPELVHEVFEATGGPAAGVQLRRLDPVIRYCFADGTGVDLPGAAGAWTDGSLAAALDRGLGAGRGDQWTGLLERGQRIWAATREAFVERPLHGARSLAGLALGRPRDLPLVAPWQSLRGLGQRRLADPRLRLMLDRYATYSGSDPRRAPAVLAAIPYLEAAGGGWYAEGGLRRIGTALAARAAERGARLRTGADVVEVLVGAGRVAGVRLAGGERLTADTVVCTADAGNLYGTLLAGTPGFAGRQLRRLRRTPPSYSGFVLLLALDGRTSNPAHHTVSFPVDYDAEFDALAAGRPVVDPTIYLSAPADPALAPAGCEAWFVLVNAPRHAPGSGTDWDRPGLAVQYRGQLLDLLAARGLLDRGRVRFAQVRTPADLARATRAPGGSIYGPSSNGVRAAFLRPANRSPLPGLYLAGGSAHPGGGLPLVLHSARIVAELIGPA